MGEVAFVRQPYTPTRDDWGALYHMLCGYCTHQTHCEITEGMIEMKDGAPWPEGGWVTDPGAGVTCLSYSPKGGAPVSRQRFRAMTGHGKTLPPVCGGCAALKGSEASVSLHTRRDYAAAVKNRTEFQCHERKGQPCGGWCRALRRRSKGANSHA